MIGYSQLQTDGFTKTRKGEAMSTIEAMLIGGLFAMAPVAFGMAWCFWQFRNDRHKARFYFRLWLFYACLPVAAGCCSLWVVFTR